MVASKVPVPGQKAPSTPAHLEWLVDTRKPLKTTEGKSVAVMEFRHKSDAKVLSAWAKHFRNQYCRDDQIDILRSGTKQSRAEYLTNIKFPDAVKAPGPSIRAGDFAEVLVADYLEFRMQFWLPRTRYDHKAVRNESTKGTDTVGFKFFKEGEFSPKDAVAFFESKAKLTGESRHRLQDAVDGSAKDEMRKAESLNAIKQRMVDAKLASEIDKIARFQNYEDHPYVEQYGAVALLCTSIYNPTEVQATIASAHPYAANLTLIVIHGQNLMRLVHDLYERAANEA